MSAVAPEPQQFELTTKNEEKPRNTKKPWLPYRLSWTETPFLFLFAKILPYWIRFRNAIVRNSCFEWRLPFPCYPSLHRLFTLAEFVIFILCLGSTIVFCVYCFYYKWEIELEVSGGVAGLALAIAFILASHNSVVTFLLGIPFERALFWHKFAAITAVVIGWVHGYWITVHTIFPITNNPNFTHTPSTLLVNQVVSGLVLDIAMTLLVIISLEPVRRVFWNGFYMVHLMLAIVVIVFGLFHQVYITIGVGAGLWLFDVLFRYLYLALLKNPHKARAVRLPANVIRLSFPKPHKFVFSPGQYSFLMIPKVNMFEWHPFSMSSSPHHNVLSFHIRVLGNWTKKLYKMLEEQKDISVHAEGPYGCPEIDLEDNKHKLFLFISGGIGVTPLQSMCNHLVHQSDNGRPIKKIWFMWCCADKYMVSSVFEHDRQWDGISNKDINRLPRSFQPDDLERINADTEGKSVLRTEFYLTRVRPEEGYEKGNIRPELQPHVRFGRPKWPETFEAMKSLAKQTGENHVCVLVCGPAVLVNQTRKNCSKYSGDGVRFEFHSESFEF